ncbi:hypothetical protein Nepgr_006656 [Nepenthes gracilis]|uniref:Uncharacterized protein n=1 Tax=Nepenthes gracilis TaxID=150966 RepID=A0AAD3XHT4_NEPGR|nr:hypothetical protein Nepgr_006656 [Nepenthes gracilis]
MPLRLWRSRPHVLLCISELLRTPDCCVVRILFPLLSGFRIDPLRLCSCHSGFGAPALMFCFAFRSSYELRIVALSGFRHDILDGVVFADSLLGGPS